MLQTISQKIQHARIRLNCKLAMIQAQEVLDGQQDLTVTVPFVSTHWETASLFDHVFIGTLARVIQPRVCFEIGTSLGLVTTTIAANTGEGTEIHTLDLSEDPRIGSFFRDRPERRKIQQHFGRSTAFDFSSVRGNVDLMFIDGSHEEPDVVLDSRNGLNTLSDRGVILWHDVSYHFPGVVNALESQQIYRIHGTGFAMYAKAQSGFNLGEQKKDYRNDVLHPHAKAPQA